MEALTRYFGDSRKWKDGMIYIAIVAIVLIFSLLVPNFFSPENWRAILTSMVLVTVLAIGITFVLTAGEIDISLGAVLSVTPTIFAVLLGKGMPFFLALVIGLAATLLLGFLNGFVTIKLGVPSFITTLGTMGIGMGLSRIVANNTPVVVRDDTVQLLFGGELLGMPKIVVWMFVLIVLSYILLHKTRYGRNLHNVGDNREAAHLYGIHVTGTVIIAFVIASFFAFFAGMLEVARSFYASPGIGEPLMLNAIVASVIGGTALTGGKGSIIGAFVGALFLTIISNALFSLGLPPWISNIIIGSVIILILTTSGLMDKRKHELGRI
ncbi:ABC transporter permease [Paenibacillus abyssi]|uniref:Autoinducer 2 import system permease protein LsrD n=1 Tax=Paenibacillus abyssi TaxID=1340531 RepID=A0A917LES5_9BACL|nr:ABC transporter permease [Paenibacillus abyssi]GGG16805.1 ABC transporter permease [Paenibacillus abyssi]